MTVTNEWLLQWMITNSYYGTCTCLQWQCRECLLKHTNFDDFKNYPIGINNNKPINYKYLASVINDLKLQNVCEQSTPQHRIVLNQIKNSTISNYVIIAPAYMRHMTDPEW